MATVTKATTRRVEGGATEWIYNWGEGEILDQFTCRRKVVKMVSLRAVSCHAVLNHSLLTFYFLDSQMVMFLSCSYLGGTPYLYITRLTNAKQNKVIKMYCTSSDKSFDTQGGDFGKHMTGPSSIAMEWIPLTKNCSSF